MKLPAVQGLSPEGMYVHTVHTSQGVGRVCVRPPVCPPCVPRVSGGVSPVCTEQN
jgi:hypothetical protein